MPAPNFTPFPTLMTERLVLRRLLTEDKAAIFKLHSDAKNRIYIDKPPSKSILEAQAFIKKMNLGIEYNKWIYWAIVLKSTLQVVGTTCIWNFSADYAKADIGYELSPPFQGKGLMQEAVSAVTSYGFKKLKLRKLEAYTHIDNESSIRLLEKSNFSFEKKLKANYQSKSGKYWMVVYSLNH